MEKLLPRQVIKMTVLKKPPSIKIPVMRASMAQARFNGEGTLKCLCGSCEKMIFSGVLYARVKEYAVECSACQELNVI